MALVKGNCLKGSFEAYTVRSVKKLVKQIPEDRKAVLAEEISARANLFGYKNGAVLQLALAHLNGEKPKRGGQCR